MEGPGGEADADTVGDIMKYVKGEDIGRLTCGTAKGTAVCLRRRDVGDAVGDGTGDAEKDPVWAGGCYIN